MRTPTQLCIFEDNHYTRLLPLVYFRPVYNLKCGIFSLREKIQRAYGNMPVSIHCRSYLSAYMRLRNPGLSVNSVTEKMCLFLNGRVVAGKNLARMIPLEGPVNSLYTNGNDVVAARVGGAKLQQLKKLLTRDLTISDFDGLTRHEVDVPLVRYPWDLVGRNGEELRADAGLLVKRAGSTKIRGTISKGAYLLNEKEIFIGEGTVVKPGVVIDAEEGPVVIGKNAKIFPQTTILGPAYIGDGSVVKMGAKIYANTSIGPVCKVGGEIEASIIHGYSNKQHDGFLGHSYLGAWVNLGAGTTNSDLKNNYGPVKVFVNGEQVDSGTQFVGVTIGDHSKSAINSMFNTGTVIGVSSNVFGSGFPPKYVPSFSWGAAGETFTTYNIDRAVDVARRVMARRATTLSEAEALLFRTIFQLTSDERRQRGMPA